MSPEPEEVTISQRVSERPAFKPSRVRQVKPRMLACRFLAGAATSVIAGIITLGFGARVGGVFLAFPAILAASLTLIEEQNDSGEAREDSRGASLGGIAMAAFAAVGALAFGHLAGALVLLLATAAWLAVAMLGYLLAWFR
jgi:small-conductance mechanosensitive channel